MFMEESLSFQPDGVSLCASHPMRLALRQRPAVWGSFRARLSLLPGLGENGAVSYVYERGVLPHAPAALSDARQGGVQPPCGRTPFHKRLETAHFRGGQGEKEPQTAGRCLSAKRIGCEAHRLTPSG